MKLAPVITGIALLTGLVSLSEKMSPQTRIDYNTQVTRPPLFPRQISVSGESMSTTYIGDPRFIYMTSVPDVETAALIRPGKCGDMKAGNIPFEYRSESAPSLIFTPVSVFACVADGTGSGFKLVKLAVSDTW